MSEFSLEVFLNETLGAAFIGFAISCVVLGVLLSQIVHYLSRYPKDRFINKALVVVILLLELGHQALIAHALYYYNIINYATPEKLLSPHETVIWSIIVQQTVGAITGVIVKVCFAARVWRFSDHDIIVTGILLALNFAELSLSMAFTYKSFKYDEFQFLPQIKTLGSFALGCGSVTDVLLAASLCFYLHRLRSKQSMHNKNVDSLITMLSTYAVSTGMMTSAIGLATLICYYLMPLNFIFISLFFVLGKLYGVSLLAALNTRQYTETNSIYHNGLSQKSGESDLDSLTSLPLRSSRQRSPGGSYSRSRSTSSKPSSIRVIRHTDHSNLSSTHIQSDFSPRTFGSNIQLPIIRIPNMVSYPGDAHGWSDDVEAISSNLSHMTG